MSGLSSQCCDISYIFHSLSGLLQLTVTPDALYILYFPLALVCGRLTNCSKTLLTRTHIITQTLSLCGQFFWPGQKSLVLYRDADR